MKPNPGKAQRGRSWICVLAFLALFFSCLALASCRSPRRGDVSLPRPQPAYTAWLEKQSMLAQADKLIGQVSQTERVWMFPASGMAVETLLKAAPQWLELCSTQFPGEAFLRRLPLDFSRMRQAGIRGLYLGPLGEDQSYWQDKGAENISGRMLPASLELDPRLGEYRDLERLGKEAENAGFELGADILNAATSMGPDFFLQARHATGHGGLYAMLELPRHLWAEAPVSRTEWEASPLKEEHVKLFSAQGILPESLYRDKRSWGSPAGWAITGEVQGTDGNPRRWIYRYEGEVSAPVLLWQDPSGLASRVFSASIIQQTGFWRLPLAGLRLSALMGLEPQGSPAAENGGISSQSLSPGLEALNILADQVHRYGGWSLQADPVPAELVERILAGSCDFCREDSTEKLLLHALENGDPSGLARLYKGWLEKGLDQRRLARGFDSPFSEASCTGAKSREAGEIPLLLHWRAGLPGLAFFSPSELGVFQPPASKQIRASSRAGEKALQSLLDLRAEYGLAEGKLIKVIENGKSTLSMLSALPEKGYWLLSTNFSSTPAQAVFALPQSCQAALEAPSGEDLSKGLQDDGQKFSIPLKGFESRQVIIF